MYTMGDHAYIIYRLYNIVNVIDLTLDIPPNHLEVTFFLTLVDTSDTFSVIIVDAIVQGQLYKP